MRVTVCGRWARPGQLSLSLWDVAAATRYWPLPNGYRRTASEWHSCFVVYYSVPVSGPGVADFRRLLTLKTSLREIANGGSSFQKPINYTYDLSALAMRQRSRRL